VPSSKTAKKTKAHSLPKNGKHVVKTAEALVKKTKPVEGDPCPRCKAWNDEHPENRHDVGKLDEVGVKYRKCNACREEDRERWGKSKK